MPTMDHILVEPARADPNAVPVRTPVRGWGTPGAAAAARRKEATPPLSGPPVASQAPFRRYVTPARRTGAPKVSQPLLWNLPSHIGFPAARTTAQNQQCS